jgi:hypothetical protein
MEEWDTAWQFQALNRDAKQLRQITKKPNALRVANPAKQSNLQDAKLLNS